MIHVNGGEKVQRMTVLVFTIQTAQATLVLAATHRKSLGRNTKMEFRRETPDWQCLRPKFVAKACHYYLKGKLSSSSTPKFHFKAPLFGHLTTRCSEGGAFFVSTPLIQMED